LCARGIDFAPFYDFSLDLGIVTVICNCLDGNYIHFYRYIIIIEYHFVPGNVIGSGAVDHPLITDDATHKPQ
jgi:hypothetical protein